MTDRSAASPRSSTALALAGLALLAGLQYAPPTRADEVAPPETAARMWDPALTYDGTALRNLHGGARTGNTYVGNLHLKLTASGDSIGWPGTSAFVDVLTVHGGHPSQWVGDAQGSSSLEGPTGTQLEELWIQHNLQGSGASLLLGIYDLNSEFYRLQAAGLFLNSAFGIGPEFAQSGVEGPSIFPRTSAGLRAALKPTPATVLRIALLDGVPVVRPDGSRAVFRGGDGLLTVAEWALLSRAGEGADSAADTNNRSALRDRIGRNSSLAPYDDKLAIGAWRYSGSFQDLSDTDAAGQPLAHRGSYGAYLIGERLLMGGDTRSGPRLSAFAQAGGADPRSNRFGSYFGAGLNGSGWAWMPDSDQFGLSIAHARNGSHYLRAQGTPGADRAETAIELAYLRQISSHFALQPDLQYVIHPGTDVSLANAWVLQLHFEITF